MKRLICILLALALLSASALAASATANQRLSFRTGPNTRYTELFTLPQSTHITPLACEEGNNVTWVLCEFMYEGRPCQGYTGAKRLDIRGSLPWAYNWGGCYAVCYDVAVYDAPHPAAAVRGYLEEGENVVYLQGSDGSGEWSNYELRLSGEIYLDYPDGYAFIEYFDPASGQSARGWVSEDALGLIGVGACRVLVDCQVLEPESAYPIDYIRANDIVADYTFLGDRPFGEVEYCDRSTGQRHYVLIDRNNIIKY